ncbi:LysR family transcriptional regulator [Burkholderia sp. PAMC 26561]|uniref:LysR family transcriptional regulator n=1 Tax=Burkholderia sp. PAMC 26561 TaxID=1795043 RepID=UPI00076B67D3|nr:LysR family transcriptional regulator [Burkholderia sp. PAMC 26561]AME26986.1 LysR family transcriptional regulator [Burkholderia sp. PAMC 26561]AME28067.1 LysR family transcriptional regulator [Burkholderia sp. PAMC 26561]
MKRNGLFELNAVMAVASHLSFRKAADDLGISASALSHTVSDMEARMAVRLFHRTTRSVALTQAGETFLAQIRPALRQIADAMESTNAHRDTPSGLLRINCFEGAASLILAPLVLEFLRRFPRMEVEIVVEANLSDIVGSGFDAGIRFADNVPKDMVAVALTSSLSMAIVGSPEYFAKCDKPIVPDDLMAHRCVRVRMSSGKLFQWEFARNSQAVKITPPGYLTLNREALIHKAALEGAGLACLGMWSIREDLRLGRLIRVLEDWSPDFPGLSLYFSGHRNLPAGLRAFVDLMREITIA